MNDTLLQDALAAHVQVLADINLSNIIGIADNIWNTLKQGKKILICGCGGSAADAQHFAAELVGRFRHYSRPALAAISLTTDTSILTALGNDYGFESVFSRQVEALGYPGDILLAVSTSGQSEAVLEAIKVAKDQEMTTIALTGLGGTRMLEEPNSKLIINSTSVARIQEAHEFVLHSICDLIDVWWKEENAALIR